MKENEKLGHHNNILEAIKRLADMPRIGLGTVSLTIDAIRGLTTVANAIYRISDPESENKAGRENNEEMGGDQT